MKENYELIVQFIEKYPNDIKAYYDVVSILKEIAKEDINFASKEMRKMYDKLQKVELTYDTASKVWQISKDMLLFNARRSLDDYLLYVEFEREPEKKFYPPRRDVLLPIVKSMQDLMDDKLDLLTISLPPGIGKTTLGIFFLTWVMGNYPDSPNLASAHSGMLTRGFFDGAMQIIKDPEYLYTDVFSDILTVLPNSKEETIDLGKKHRFSTLTCRAINASLTGATRCEKILYCDDLCSGIEEALSKDRLDSLWVKYTNDLKSRKKIGAKEIHIATRWSVHDVIGRLEREYDNNDRARFISVPALNMDGESNFNYKYNVGFDTAYFVDMRNTLDDASWRALYMNQPIEREGLLYQEDELRRYFELPEGEPDAIYSVCDTKDKGTDYAVCPIAYQYGNDYYIVDVVCDNNRPEAVEPRIENLLVKWKPHLAQFESNSAGGRVAKDIQEHIKSRGCRTKITTKYTTTNKETKIITNSPFVKERFLFKDESLYEPKSDYGRMINMLCSYTMAGKNKHDDVPDALSMLSQFVQNLATPKIEIFQRPF